MSTVQVTPSIDTAEDVKALRLILEPGQVTELRVLDAVTLADRRPHVESGYFDSPEKLTEAVATIKAAKGFYFTPNPVAPALLSRAANRVRPAGREPRAGRPAIRVARKFGRADGAPAPTRRLDAEGRLARRIRQPARYRAGGIQDEMRHVRELGDYDKAKQQGRFGLTQQVKNERLQNTQNARARMWTSYGFM
jgi:hypothetical protein